MRGVERRWYRTPAGWRHADVGVGQIVPMAGDEIRAVELIFLAFVALGTSFTIASALMSKEKT
jgi:hypothetical protein